MRFRLWHIVDIVWLKWWFLWAKSVIITFWSGYSCCEVQQEEVQNDGTRLNTVLDALLTYQRQTGWHWLALVLMHSSDKQSFFHTEDIKNVKKIDIYIPDVQAVWGSGGGILLLWITDQKQEVTCRSGMNLGCNPAGRPPEMILISKCSSCHAEAIRVIAQKCNLCLFSLPDNMSYF